MTTATEQQPPAWSRFIAHGASSCITGQIRAVNGGLDM
jgi:hypothetical protein